MCELLCLTWPRMHVVRAHPHLGSVNLLVLGVVEDHGFIWLCKSPTTVLDIVLGEMNISLEDPLYIKHKPQTKNGTFGNPANLHQAARLPKPVL